ncbi:ABC transporter ATP-binding protein [Micavibrio aeruginosavorus]|uniref:ABC transporter family protein n=1 Tax=Micavibrio aeruginosavorus (strain ARL-13) TaxID=856793 RepID=G2KPT7_MICAA|nr:ABC transporter ATP-binding protein [Micavibrio aeruginosavorus]AEP09906.1 ABC transporter family protein [Micavibrio aeruginosavorus ARL-13]
MSLLKPHIPAAPYGELPTSFGGFLLYVWRKNPVLWGTFMLQDIVHFTRYPIAFILLGKIIDILKDANPADGLPAAAWSILGLMMLVLAVGEFAHIWTAHTILHWKPKLRTVIRGDFLSYTMGHSHAYFQDNFAGALARKVSEVAESALRLHDIIRFQIWFATIHMGITLIFMFTVSPLYGCALLFFILAVTVPLFARIPKIRQRSLRYSEQRAHVTGMVVDMLTNIPAVKSFATLPHEIDVHTAESHIERTRHSKLMRNMIQIEDLRRLCLVTLGGGMTALACLGWAHGWITVGQASSVATMSMMLTGTTWILGGGIMQFVDEAGYITDALRITARPHEISDTPGAKPLQVDRGTIEYRGVNFAFANFPIFRELNLKITAGEKIALVGPSGAGKSTFVSVLLRLYDLHGGEITIDGQNIAHVTQDSLRQAVAIIPQDTALFHRSLMENIRYGRLDATDDEVIAAAKKAYADDFINTLPEGYNTLVGERGIRLSGGQRQRIAIARAILKNAPILILDEATSALDSESERLIQQALDDLMKGKTVIAIAHRLSTIARMDRIIVLDRGVIAEQGNHETLLKNHGLYARLWSMQSGGFLHADDIGGGSSPANAEPVKSIDG